MRLHDVGRDLSRRDSIQNHDRFIESIISSRSFVFLIVFQQKTKRVQMNDVSQMRHIDFHVKRADRHENVEFRLSDETLQNAIFVFDFVEIRVTFDENRSKLTVRDSIAIHQHFFVRF